MVGLESSSEQNNSIMLHHNAPHHADTAPTPLSCRIRKKWNSSTIKLYDVVPVLLNPDIGASLSPLLLGFHLLSHNKMNKSNNFLGFDSFCVMKATVQDVFRSSALQQLISWHLAGARGKYPGQGSWLAISNWWAKELHPHCQLMMWQRSRNSAELNLKEVINCTNPG